jgi:hypothetical protein
MFFNESFRVINVNIIENAKIESNQTFNNEIWFFQIIGYCFDF